MKKAAQISLVYFRLSENWIHTQLKNLTDWESVVFTNRVENLDAVSWKPTIYSRVDRLPVGVREADSLAMWIMGYYPSFFYQAKKQNIDLVHAHFGTMGYLGSALAKAMDVPLVTTFYGYDASMLPKREPKWKSRYKKLFDRGSRFLVEGPAMREKLVDLGCPSEKITIHHLGIELEKYSPRDWNDTEQDLQIMMVGRFVEKKGFIYGLKAFQKFLRKGGSGTMTIVGDSTDSPESEAIKQELLNYVDEHKLHEAVSFSGLIPLEELRQEYYDHNLFLAPSVEAKNGDNEGGAPVTIIEASATGMPVIGSLHCDIPEVVKDGETGLLADERDMQALAEHMISVYNDPELRRTLGQAGAKYIRENFDAQKQGEKLSQIYSACLGF